VLLLGRASRLSHGEVRLHSISRTEPSAQAEQARKKLRAALAAYDPTAGHRQSDEMTIMDDLEMVRDLLLPEPPARRLAEAARARVLAQPRRRVTIGLPAGLLAAPAGGRPCLRQQRRQPQRVTAALVVGQVPTGHGPAAPDLPPGRPGPAVEVLLRAANSALTRPGPPAATGDSPH